LQRRGSVHEVNLGASAGFDMRDLGFLEIRLDPIGIAVDQGHHGFPLRGKRPLCKGEICDETIDLCPQLGSLACW
jgi:hypothetical protein